MIKQLKDQQIKQLKEKKEKKKNIEKTRKKAIKGLVDFNNFIRDEVGEPRQKDRLTQQLLISNKKSSRTIDDEKKSDELIQCISHGFKMYFFTTDKITKTLIKKGKNSLYKKDIVFVSIYNGLAYISFLATQTVDPKFFLLFVDLFTSKIYTYSMKKKKCFSKKNGIIFQRHRKKRLGKMRLQTDQEFKHRNIEQLKKINIEMYSST